MHHSSLYERLAQSVNRARLMETLARIWENDRLFSFDAFSRTANVCAERMGEAGLADIEALSLKADGYTTYGDWVIPCAWDARSARLEIVSPKVAAPELAEYPRIPCSLVMYSAPTPPEGVLGELLFVRDRAALLGRDLRGKMLFIRDDKPQSLIAAALAGGARGILSDYFPLYPGVRDRREDVYDAHRWENGFAAPRNDAGLFAFSLSPRQGDLLEALAQRGPVTLRARVDTRLYCGTAATVSALLPGLTDGEVLGYGHLYEPGAEDNASGCAALIEAAWMLGRAIDAGRLPRPRRGIRVAMGFECAGSMGYFSAHPERIGRTAAGLVADMVGTQRIDNAVMAVWHNPLANYGYVDRLIVEQIAAIEAGSGAPFPYRERAFTIGTDNILADPCFRMPTVALVAEPALSYHSSMDHIDRIEPDVLARSAVLCAMYLYAAASAPDGRFDPDPVRERLAPIGGNLGVPTRLVPGCLTFEGGERVSRMSAEERGRYEPAWNRRLNIPLFWADGQRTVSEIAALSAWELGEADAGAFAEMLDGYFALLAKYGYVSVR